MRMVKNTEVQDNYLVSKSNQLIYANYDLSLQEQRLILAIVSLIDSIDGSSFETYELKATEFAELLGVDNPHYSYLQRITKKLMTRVIEIEDDNKLTQLHWVESCTYLKNTGTVRIRISKELSPYLLQLKKHFTKYQISNILKMKSKYSIRLYEILKSNQFKRKFSISMNELREMMKLDGYDRFSNFNQKVLKPALKEINNQTDIFAIVEVQSRRGRDTILHFEVISKKKLEQEVFESLTEKI